MKFHILNKYFKNLKTRKWLLPAFPGLVFLLFFYFSVPAPLFNTPTSTILVDQKGELLSARIAADGQWRFPLTDSVPQKFETALLTFEDKAFYAHPGVDFRALLAALYANLKAGKIIRGGSTITMQVIRLSRKNPERSVIEKFLEIVRAFRLETQYDKKEILRFYASEAPFGGNIVGLDAASWRYFSRPAWKLSWAEASMLAVLPNSPALIYPGKNQELLLAKRNKLLKKLYTEKKIDSLTYRVSIGEPIPAKPNPLPMYTPHLLNLAEKQNKGSKKIKTYINTGLQKNIGRILEQHAARLEANQIFNAAALVVEVESGKVIAYHGNIPTESREDKGYAVDIIHSLRSTGSILKPLLYSMILHEGKYLPEALVADIPTIYAGYAPKNYFGTYDGAVPLKQAIARSLNVPAVRLLQEYGIEKFHTNLKRLGMTTLSRPANHYGLSLILGGAEAKLWDMAQIYRNLAWHLNHYHLKYKKEQKALYPITWQANLEMAAALTTSGFPDPASVFYTFEAMNEVSRPEELQSWREFTSSYKIAWKTGTSFGNRDAWAIGCTPAYVVAVWAGNASGEGRPGLTGLEAAAPVMFDIFRLLKSPSWFLKPFNNLKKHAVCKQSGYSAGEGCIEQDSIWVPVAGKNSKICPYHKFLFLSYDQKFQVNADCEQVYHMKRTPWFILPPVMEYYYKIKHPDYRLQPPYRSDCQSSSEQKKFSLIYPLNKSKVFVPRELDGKPGKVVFEATSPYPTAVLYWYLDDQFLTVTNRFHQIELNPEPGWHLLTVTAEDGESRQVYFEALDKKER